MTDFTNVSARAVLVGLWVSFWSARKLDKRVTKETNAREDANPNAARVNKNLLAGSESHSKLVKFVGAARAVHYEQTLPWAEGWRLLPVENYMAYTDEMRKQRAEFDRLLEAFLDEYPDLVRKAREVLGSMYSAREFPSECELRRRFSWDVETAPVPTRGDIRVDLPADEIAVIERAIETRVENATREAMKDAWSRLHEAVARVTRAAAKDGRVYDNVIDNVRETCDILGRLNVGKDAGLEKMRQRVLKELGNVVPSDIREDDTLRAATEKKAKAIANAMSAFYTPPAPDDAE